jgi:hypothetical protein
VNKRILGPQGLTIDVPLLFVKYLDAAIVRLRMHYPALVFSGANCGIAIAGGLKVTGTITPQMQDAPKFVAR